MITTTDCPCCDEITFHIELDKDGVSYDGETLYYSLSRDDMQALYFELKERLLHDN